LQGQRNAQIEITNVLENLQIAEDRRQWSKKLYEQGFETKSNLDKDQFGRFAVQPETRTSAKSPPGC